MWAFCWVHFSAVPVSSRRGLLSLPLHWVFFAFHRSFTELGSCCAWPPPWGGVHAKVVTARLNRGHGSIDVRRVYASRLLSHHTKDLEWRTLKPPWCVTALWSWTDHVIALRSQMDHVIALRQISVTAQFYLEDSPKIHLQGVRARRSKDVKRRASQHRRERESASFGTCFYMFLSPWVCPT